MLIPCAVSSSTAGAPSTVPGTLSITFGRANRCHSSFTSAMVPAVSWARPGEASRLTKPSPPFVLS